MRFAIISIALCASPVFAHSWVECTDYDPPSFEYDQLGNYDRSRCSGYSRGFATQFSAGFGVDTGYNWEHTMCREQFNAGDYTDSIPMATYTAGQVIYISHPAKNHVADCGNAFIPDGGIQLLMSSVVGDDTFDVSLPMLGGQHVFGQVDHLGYQRCFDFCNNPDKSHCVSGWTLPTDIATGRHSFLWLWEFNENQFYVNCFDAMIAEGGVDTTAAPSTNNITTEPATMAPTATVSPSNGSGSSSGSFAGSFENNETITIAPSATTIPSTTTIAPSTTTTIAPSTTTTTPAPTPTENFTVETITSIPTPSATSFSSSPTATPETTTSPEVITSSANSISSPLSDIGHYIIQFVGNASLDGMFNITKIGDTLRRL